MKKHAGHAKAKKHMEKASHHMEMAHKAMGKVGSSGEEVKMAKKGDYKGNKAKKSNKPVESKK